MYHNRKIILTLAIVFAVVSLVNVSCREVIIPKPYGYYRIHLPEKNYQLFQSADCGIQFDYPVYAEMAPYTGKEDADCWYNMDLKEFGARLHISYLPIDQNRLRIYIDESYSLAYKHQVKASGIEEERISRPEAKVYGIIYHIRGNAASPLQFFVTDSLQHFLRGSLYFQNRPNSDSLAPVLGFIETDIDRLIASLQWKTQD